MGQAARPPKAAAKRTIVMSSSSHASWRPTWPREYGPPQHVRELRQLITQRRRLVEMHTEVSNRLHSIPKYPRRIAPREEVEHWLRRESTA